MDFQPWNSLTQQSAGFQPDRVERDAQLQYDEPKQNQDERVRELASDFDLGSTVVPEASDHLYDPEFNDHVDHCHRIEAMLSSDKFTPGMSMIEEARMPATSFHSGRSRTRPLMPNPSSDALI